MKNKNEKCDLKFLSNFRKKLSTRKNIEIIYYIKNSTDYLIIHLIISYKFM